MNTYIYTYIQANNYKIPKFAPFYACFLDLCPVTCPVSGRHTECGWITSSTSRQCRIAGSGRQCGMLIWGIWHKFGEFYPRNSWYCWKMVENDLENNWGEKTHLTTRCGSLPWYFWWKWFFRIFLTVFFPGTIDSLGVLVLSGEGF